MGPGSGADEDSMKIADVWIDGGATYFFTRRLTTSDALVLGEFGEQVQGEQRFAPHSEE
jgi:hypothetical protein